MQINDTELLAQLIENSSVAAFSRLFERYHHAIYRNVVRSLHDSFIAEDIVQEVFATLWEKRAMLSRNQSIGGWLFTVSYHKILDHLRENSKKVILPQDAIPDGQMEDIISRESDFALLENGIAQLSPKKRRAFELCKLQGKSYEEAAVTLGVSKYTINEYLKESMAFLRQYVKNNNVIYTTGLTTLLSIYLL